MNPMFSMRFRGFTSVVLLGVCLIGAAHADFRRPVSQARIYDHIPFAQAGSLDEFDATMKQTRDQVRQQLEGEFGDMIQPLAANADDVSELAKTIANIILVFDGVYRTHRDEAVQGMPLTFEQLFMTSYDQLATDNDLPESARKAIFVPLNDPSHMNPATLLNSVDYILYGTYSIGPNSTVLLTLTLEDILTGESLHFDAGGKPESAVRILAQELFDFFQGNRYPDWINPQPNLQWLKPPGSLSYASATIAKMYCRGQNARLPYARELIQASFAGDYRPGGIPPLDDDSHYLVADQQRYAGDYTYRPNDAEYTGGPVRTDPMGRVEGYFWCVRGEPSADVMLVEQIYRLIRQARHAGAAPRVLDALEYVLVKLDDFGQRPDEADAFFSYEEARDFLRTQGYWVPDSLE